MLSLAERNARMIADLARWEIVLTPTFTLYPRAPRFQDRIYCRWSVEDMLEDPAMRRWDAYAKRHAA